MTLSESLKQPKIIAVEGVDIDIGTLTLLDKLKDPKIIAVIAIAIVIITIIVILIFIPSECKEGTFSVNGKNPWFGKCTKCATGTSAKEGSSECTKCASGTSAKEGSSECTKCASGTYSIEGGKCEDQCPNGTYSIEEGKCEDQCSNLPKTKKIQWGTSNDPSFKSQNTELDTIVRGPGVKGDNRITDACLAQLHDMSGCTNLAVKTMSPGGKEDNDTGNWYYDGYRRPGCAPLANQDSKDELDSYIANPTKNEEGWTKTDYCVQQDKDLYSITNDMNAWRIMNDGHHPSGCCNKDNKAGWGANTSTRTYDSPCIN